MSILLALSIFASLRADVLTDYVRLPPGVPPFSSNVPIGPSGMSRACDLEDAASTFAAIDERMYEAPRTVNKWDTKEYGPYDPLNFWFGVPGPDLCGWNGMFVYTPTNKYISRRFFLHGNIERLAKWATNEFFNAGLMPGYPISGRSTLYRPLWLGSGDSHYLYWSSSKLGDGLPGGGSEFSPFNPSSFWRDYLPTFGGLDNDDVWTTDVYGTYYKQGPGIDLLTGLDWGQPGWDPSKCAWRNSNEITLKEVIEDALPGSDGWGITNCWQRRLTRASLAGINGVLGVMDMTYHIPDARAVGSLVREFRNEYTFSASQIIKTGAWDQDKQVWSVIKQGGIEFNDDETTLSIDTNKSDVADTRVRAATSTVVSRAVAKPDINSISLYDNACIFPLSPDFIEDVIINTPTTEGWHEFRISFPDLKVPLPGQFSAYVVVDEDYDYPFNVTVTLTTDRSYENLKLETFPSITRDYSYGYTIKKGRVSYAQTATKAKSLTATVVHGMHTRTDLNDGWISRMAYDPEHSQLEQYKCATADYTTAADIERRIEAIVELVRNKHVSVLGIEPENWRSFINITETDQKKIKEGAEFKDIKLGYGHIILPTTQWGIPTYIAKAYKYTGGSGTIEYYATQDDVGVHTNLILPSISLAIQDGSVLLGDPEFVDTHGVVVDSKFNVITAKKWDWSTLYYE